MMSGLEGGEGGSQKVDKSTDKLRDHVCDKGGGGVKKSEIFADVIDGSPLMRMSYVHGPIPASRPTEKFTGRKPKERIHAD